MSVSALRRGPVALAPTEVPALAGGLLPEPRGSDPNAAIAALFSAARNFSSFS